MTSQRKDADLQFLEGENEHLHTWERVCKHHCHMDSNAGFHNALGNGCNRFKFMMPRPKVFRFCSDAFKHSLDLTCSNMCNGLGSSRSISDHHAGQFCKRYRQEMPKPGAYQSCEAGFLAAHNAVSKFHSDKQAEWEKKRAAGETPEQAEKEMEEEAIIEEKIVAEVPKDAPIDEKKIHEKVQQIESELKKHENTTKPVPDIEIARAAARAAFEAQVPTNDTDEIDL